MHLYVMDKLHKFQIIFPYASTKLHIAKNIHFGAKLCYGELKENDNKEPLFIIHDLDANEFYHYEIPKNKNNDKRETKQNDKNNRICAIEHEIDAIKLKIENMYKQIQAIHIHVEKHDNT